MSRPHAGSILLLCLAVVAAMSMIAFGFVRVVQLQDASSRSVNHQVLAREATLAGVNHAYEQIIRDYVSEPFTRMDGPARSAFVSHAFPYNANGFCNPSDGSPWGEDIDGKTPGGSIAADVDDVAAERVVHAATKDAWWDGYLDPWGAYNLGHFMYDGRGRYYEPEFYNRAARTVVAGNPLPTAPVRFGTDLGTADHFPDRKDGIFFDERWRRIPGDARLARTKARYRLRYAVGVMDLDGAILVNPDPAIDYTHFDEADPRVFESPSPRASPLDARILRAQHAIAAIGWARTHFGQSCLDNANEGTGIAGGMTAGVRAEHVFLGRGFTSNFDSRAPAHVPSTFPLAYHPASSYVNFLQAYATGATSCWPAEDLYANASVTPVVTGKKGGGEAIGYGSSGVLSRVLMGPQYSFNNFDFAMAGGYGEGANQWDGTVRSLGSYTPFGRGLTKGAIGRFSGHVDTPWSVNIMTAPGMAVFSMVAAYMPPGAFTAYYHSSTEPGKSYYADLNGARDLFVRELSPAFSRYAAPARSSPAIAPDYHVPARHLADPAYRKPEQRYPGVLAFNGYTPNETTAHEWANDGLGRWLRATGTPTAPVKAGVADSAWGANPNASAAATAVVVAPANVQVTVVTGGSRYTAGTAVAITGGSGTYASAVPTIAGGVITAITVNGAAGYTVNDALRVVITDPSPQWAGKVLAAHDPYTGFCLWQRYDGWRGDVGYGITLRPGGEPDYTPPHKGAPGNTGGAPVEWDQFLVGTHPDSIWEAIGQAMAATVAVVRGQWMDYPTANGDPRTWFNGGVWPNPATRAASIQDIDALFLANLGIAIADPTNPVPPAGCAWTSAPNGGVASFTPTWNLATLAQAGSTWFADATGPLPGTYAVGTTTLPYTQRERTQAMELIINDFRLSFFGSSPGYGDAFRPLDLNGDGKVACSGYPVTADPDAAVAQRDTDLGIDRYFDTRGGSAAPAVTDWFSSTGVFFLGKSRYWRVMARGEVWDNLFKVTVSDAMLDSVICIDPVDAAREFTGAAGDPAAGQYASHVIYQRWFFDKYRGHLSRRY